MPQAQRRDVMSNHIVDAARVAPNRLPEAVHPATEKQQGIAMIRAAFEPSSILRRRTPLPLSPFPKPLPIPSTAKTQTLHIRMATLSRSN
jgi:hypothetical protein